MYYDDDYSAAVEAAYQEGDNDVARAFYGDDEAFAHVVGFDSAEGEFDDHSYFSA